MAGQEFGDRIKFWHDGHDIYGHYEWKEVHESIRSYGVAEEVHMSDDILSATEPNQKISLGIQIDTTTGAVPPSSDVFVIKEISHKGKGLVATEDIPKGTRVLAEKPLFTVSSSGQKSSAFNKTIAEKLRNLDKDDQRAFLELHNNWVGNSPLGGIVRTNALPLGPASPQGGVFLTASRINHSCNPNTQHTWNSKLSMETIHATQVIAKGEEITISYIGEGEFKTRNEKFWGSFGFVCSCDLCSLPEAERSDREGRRVKMEVLDQSIGSAMQMFRNPARSLAEARELIDLFKQENINDARVPRAYYDAFQIAVSHGDLARARAFATKALETRTICEGGDSPEVEKVRGLMENPMKHPSYQALSNRWQMKAKDLPRGLGEKEFESWLWERVNF
jgi:SET domain